MTIQKITLPAVIIVLLAATLLCSGCIGRVPVPPPPAQPYPAPQPTQPALPPPGEATGVPAPVPPAYAPRTGPAGTLYADAEKALARGEPEQAEMLVERALRIEPRNPDYWHTLARIKYARGEYAQTVQLCRKSTSLAGGQPQLIERNNHLMRQAEAQR